MNIKLIMVFNYRIKACVYIFFLLNILLIILNEIHAANVLCFLKSYLTELNCM